MADYLVILDSETNPNAPLRSSLFKRMVANPIAIAEGASGAPKVLDAALDTGAATTAGITWVGLRMAAATQGGVGTYAFLGKSGGTSQPATAFGATEAGSELTPIGFSQGGGSTAFAVGGGTRAGTWRCMGNVPTATGSGAVNGSLWLRIA